MYFESEDNTKYRMKLGGGSLPGPPFKGAITTYIIIKLMAKLLKLSFPLINK